MSEEFQAPSRQVKRQVNRKAHGVFDDSRAGDIEITLTTGEAMKVSVFSGVKAGLLRQVTVPDQRADDRNRQAVAIAAGAAAEHLCETYGDILNPDEVARRAAALFHETLSKLRLEELREAAVLGR